MVEALVWDSRSPSPTLLSINHPTQLPSQLWHNWSPFPSHRLLFLRYPMGCKRILLSNTYLSVLNQPNVTLIPERMTSLRPLSAVSESGKEVAADVVIFATGFDIG